MGQQILWARQALTSSGWQSDVSIAIDHQGHISSIKPDSAPAGMRLDVLLPGMANLHSHAFQRAMAGQTEYRSANTADSFWSWRELMYRFVAELQPMELQAIAALAQMEMLEAGFTAVGEFHYLHHQANGQRYENVGEMCQRIGAAVSESGIGLCLLPVLYQQGGCDGQAPTSGQARFINSIASYQKLLDSAATTVAQLDNDCSLGVAPHSLRAVSKASLLEIPELLPRVPVHIHIAEQEAEIREVQMHFGQRPVEWLIDNLPVDHRWCLVHATHMTPQETQSLAKSAAVAGLCPITEANLGDGIFPGSEFISRGGQMGIGSDSCVRISLSEELRMLEYSQRLSDKARVRIAGAKRSNGRTLYEDTCLGGAQALGRNSGRIEVGALADLVALNGSSLTLEDKHHDAILDSWIFTGDDQLVTEVWSAGRHLVSEGRHIRHNEITQRYRQTMAALQARL